MKKYLDKAVTIFNIISAVLIELYLAKEIYEYFFPTIPTIVIHR